MVYDVIWRHVMPKGLWGEGILQHVSREVRQRSGVFISWTKMHDRKTTNQFLITLLVPAHLQNYLLDTGVRKLHPWVIPNNDEYPVEHVHYLLIDDVPIFITIPPRQHASHYYLMATWKAFLKAKQEFFQPSRIWMKCMEFPHSSHTSVDRSVKMYILSWFELCHGKTDLKVHSDVLTQSQ